ncbi:hypothetical protein NC651_008395 [Populus alba x Populus x berolinensis]|nr:hypothetical protein NC651_008395 [Populus alba x Populus x berolinensis]
MSVDALISKIQFKKFWLAPESLSNNRVTISSHVNGSEAILYSHDDHEDHQAITHAMITRSEMAAVN